MRDSLWLRYLGLFALGFVVGGGLVTLLVLGNRDADQELISKLRETNAEQALTIESLNRSLSRAEGEASAAARQARSVTDGLRSALGILDGIRADDLEFEELLERLPGIIEAVRELERAAGVSDK